MDALASTAVDQGDALSLALVVLVGAVATWLANRGEARALYELVREVGWRRATAAAVTGAVLLATGVAALLFFA